MTMEAASAKATSAAATAPSLKRVLSLGDLLV